MVNSILKAERALQTWRYEQLCGCSCVFECGCVCLCTDKEPTAATNSTWIAYHLHTLFASSQGPIHKRYCVNCKCNLPSFCFLFQFSKVLMLPLLEEHSRKSFSFIFCPVFSYNFKNDNEGELYSFIFCCFVVIASWHSKSLNFFKSMVHGSDMS